MKTLAVALLLCAALSGPVQAEAQVSAIGYQPVRTIGQLEGAEQEIFGEIRDIALLPDGRFVVLDEGFLHLRLYSRDGELLDIAGRSGRGPGEFFVPESVEGNDQGGVTVLDRGNARLSRWLVGDDSLALEGTTRLGFQASDHCSFDGRDFVVGPLLALTSDESSVPMIHEVSRAGDILQSFGEAADPGSLDEPFYSIAQRTFNSGPLECLEERAAVYWLPTSIGVLHAFGPEGQELWARRVENFQALEATMTERGTMIYQSRGSGDSWTAGKSVTALDQDRLLVQVDSFWYPTVPENRKTLGYVLDAGTGEHRSAKLFLPTVAEAKSDRALAFRNLPWPTVLILERVGGGYQE